jgi:hypothetical protein
LLGRDVHSFSPAAQSKTRLFTSRPPAKSSSSGPR